MEFVFWVLIAFISGSVPWALFVGKLISGRDVRTVGDKNPGTANAWKLGGWIPGMTSLLLDVGKAWIPVYCAKVYLDLSLESGWTELTAQIGFAIVAVAPIVGHGWSPFLKFKGGKALASSLGSWAALTYGLAIPAAFVLLALAHGLQKNHAITVTFVLGMFLVVFFPFYPQPHLLFFEAGMMSIVVYKHRGEYGRGLILRRWAFRLLGR